MIKKEKLISDFKNLSHQDKYDKVFVYLDIIRQTTPEMVWLYWLVNEIWLDIWDDILIEIYSNLVSLIDYQQIQKFDQIKEKLQKQYLLKKKHDEQQINESNQAEDLLKNI